MTSPKKKLPTGPIRIERPLSKPAETPSVLSQEQKSSEISSQDFLEVKKQDSFLQENSLPESSENDSRIQETIFDDIQPSSESILSSPKLESSNLESRKQESVIKENIKGRSEAGFSVKEDAFLAISKPESINQESEKQELSIQETEYKKVAMRLSAEAVERLRALRATTTLPYEILVDVMIRNWDNLPAKLQKYYLSEAKQARIQRLIAGQEKAMKTVRNKLLD